MSLFRVVFHTAPPDAPVTDPHNALIIEAPDMAAAMAAVALKHEHCAIISCKLEGAALSITEQRDGLIRALRPLYTVCRALLDNPHAAPLFTDEMRKGLEGMCADAVAAMKLAGVIR